MIMKKHTQPVGRPRGFDETKVLKKVMELFWSRGYEGTGLADIISSTGLAKGSLYKTFGNKQNMYIQALSLYEKLYVDSAFKALTDNSCCPETRVIEFLCEPMKALTKKKDRKGCFLCNASADRADIDQEIQTLVQRGYAKLSKALQINITNLNCDIAPDIVIKKAEALLAIYSGLQVMARSGVEKKRMQAAIDGGLLILQINTDT